MDNIQESQDNIRGRRRRRRIARRLKKGKKLGKRLTRFQTRQTTARTLPASILTTGKPVSKKQKRAMKRITRRLAKGKVIRRSTITKAKGEKTRIGKAIFAVALAPLLPFKGVMIKSLRSRGKYSSGMKWPNVVTTFFNEFVSKKNNLTSDFDVVSDNFMENETDSLAVGAIVTAIISFFKKRKEKRVANKKLQDVQDGKQPFSIITEREKTILQQPRETLMEKIQGAATVFIEKRLKRQEQMDEPITRGDVGGGRPLILKKGSPLIIGLAIMAALVVAYMIFKK